MLAALLSLLCLTGNSCRSEDMNGKTYPKDFILSYYLELQDGTNTEVYQGTSSLENVSRFSDYPQYGLTIINFHIPGNESQYLNGIAGMLLLDKKQQPYPFGESITSNEFSTSLTLVTDSKYVESWHAGTQQLSNIRYFYRGHNSHHGKVAFRYDFNDVSVRDQITRRQYTINGHIISKAVQTHQPN